MSTRMLFALGIGAILAGYFIVEKLPDLAQKVIPAKFVDNKYVQWIVVGAVFFAGWFGIRYALKLVKVRVPAV